MEGLEKKFAEEIKANSAALELKLQELEGAMVKGEDITKLANTIEAMETKNEELRTKMQEQLDHIAGDQKKKAAMIEKEQKEQNPLGYILKENADAIKGVSSSNSLKIEVKDMTFSGNFSGAAPRVFNQDPVVRPAQKVNVEDLARIIPIAEGAYTYTRSALTSGSVAEVAEGVAKPELVYTYTNVTASTEFIAGRSIFSKKMRNNLAWMESTLNLDLRRDYYKGENAEFQTVLAAQATASSSIITGNTKAGMLVDDCAALENIDFEPQVIVVRPSDWYSILKTPKDDLEAVVTFEGGMLRVNGVPCVKATWLPANKYYVGDWSRVSKVVTEGWSLEFSESDNDNFTKNNITARVEAQVALTVEQPDALIYGDFTAV